MALNKSELVHLLAHENGWTLSSSKTAVDSIFKVISEQLNFGKTVKIQNFGSFEPKRKKERIGRNPKTGEIFPISERIVVYFKPSEGLIAQ